MHLHVTVSSGLLLTANSAISLPFLMQSMPIVPSIGLLDAGPGVVSALTRPEQLFDGCRGEQSTIVLADAYNIAGLQWSPDDQWLVFSANFDPSSDQVWLFKPATGERLALTPTTKMP
ncbi:hypothetical protein [Herpetosiphon geysericola]|nr:hypothetical protein [Herpetosiphon geysericola]